MPYGGTVALLQAPDALGTVITGINDKGAMVGYYSDPNTDPDAPDWAPKYVVHGFKSVIPNSGFLPPTESIGGSEAAFTYVTGINNNGDIIGYNEEPLDPFEDKPSRTDSFSAKVSSTHYNGTRETAMFPGH